MRALAIVAGVCLPLTAFAGEAKVEICHFTGSATNPYEIIDVSAAALPAHEDHGDFPWEAWMGGTCKPPCQPDALPFGAGSGTPDDPYQICSEAHLRNVYTEPLASYVQRVDLELVQGGFSPIWWFGGDYDGLNHTITGLLVYKPTWPAGLFASVYQGGSVHDLSVEGDVVGATGTGGIIGELFEGSATHLAFTGTVTGNLFVGGIVGFNQGTLTDVTALAEVTANQRAGTVVGHNEGTIERGYGKGTVFSMYVAGGFAGANKGTIRDSEADFSSVPAEYGMGNVEARWYTGGFVGSNYGTIEDCRANVDVSSLSAVMGNWTAETGGFSGKNRGSDAHVIRCAATGDVEGELIVGGFTGTNSNGGTIDQSWSTGDVSGTNRVGGFEGEIKRDDGCCTLTSNSYSTGSVTGTGTLTGGFVGGIWAHDQTLIMTSLGAAMDVTTPDGELRPAFVGGAYNGAEPLSDHLQDDYYVETKGALDDTVETVTGVAPAASADAYPGLDFKGGTWVIPLENPLSPWGADHPVLAWQCGQDGIVCP